MPPATDTTMATTLQFKKAEQHGFVIEDAAAALVTPKVKMTMKNQ